MGDEVFQCACVEFGAEDGVAGGQWGGAVGEEFEIKAGAAYDDRGFAAGLNVCDDRLRHPQVCAGVG